MLTPIYRILSERTNHCNHIQITLKHQAEFLIVICYLKKRLLQAYFFFLKYFPIVVNEIKIKQQYLEKTFQMFIKLGIKEPLLENL